MNYLFEKIATNSQISTLSIKISEIKGFKLLINS